MVRANTMIQRTRRGNQLPLFQVWNFICIQNFNAAYPTENVQMQTILEKRELAVKYMNELRKNMKYVEETDWMFSTASYVPFENLTDL